ncbi:hypothetical protein ScPMuIL_001269 [Solemya velum]
MAGVVLENLSWKKLIILGVFLLLLLLTFFLIGGLIAPAPSNVIYITGTKCIANRTHLDHDKWFIPRGHNEMCDQIWSFDDERVEKEIITASQIVFSFWIPHPKEGGQLKMYRWFQTLLGVLTLDIKYDPKNPVTDKAKLQLDARIGYRGADDDPKDWKLLAQSLEERQLDCAMDEAIEGYHYKCDILQLFELGSVHYDYYLVNIRLPTFDNSDVNAGIGVLEDLHLVVIHQNGGFTKVWLSMKTVLFPMILALLIWYWRRITQLERPPSLLEKTLFVLGIALSLLNLPMEWLTCWLYLPFMLLVGDIRQGIFYAVLLSFWLIFAGEHLMDQVERNKLVMYWKHLSAVGFGCLCLFIFEICERGIQLTDPFFSVWVTDVGANLALTFIVLAGVAACSYFLFLCYMIFKVFRNISAKKSALPQMSKARKKYYMGLIYRFRFLMALTLVCAALTVIFFIISQVSEGQWKWGDDGIHLEYTSAFFTGVYGMWNVYVFGLLCLYAPSHKVITVTEDTDQSQEETVQLTHIPSEASALASDSQPMETSALHPSEGSILQGFMSKQAAD